MCPSGLICHPPPSFQFPYFQLRWPLCFSPTPCPFPVSWRMLFSPYRTLSPSLPLPPHSIGIVCSLLDLASTIWLPEESEGLLGWEPVSLRGDSWQGLGNLPCGSCQLSSSSSQSGPGPGRTTAVLGTWLFLVQTGTNIWLPDHDLTSRIKDRIARGL